VWSDTKGIRLSGPTPRMLYTRNSRSPRTRPLGPGPLGRDLEKGVDGGIYRGDAGQVVIRELPGRDLALAQLLTPCGDPHPPGCQLNWTLSADLR